MTGFGRTGPQFAVLAMAGTRAVWAADVPFAAPQATLMTGTGGGLLRTVVALLLVLAAVLATAWFARRLRGLSGGDAGALAVLAQLPLGARERAVLIRAGGQRLLLGVAPGNVRMLHVLNDGDAAPGTAADETAANAIASSGAHGEPPRPSFRSLLLRSLGK